MAAIRCAGGALLWRSLAGGQEQRAGLQSLQQYFSSPRGFHSLHRPAPAGAPLPLGAAGSARGISNARLMRDLKEKDKREEELERAAEKEEKTKKRNELAVLLMQPVSSYNKEEEMKSINELFARLEFTANGNDDETTVRELRNNVEKKKQELLKELFMENDHGHCKEKKKELIAAARQLQEFLNRQDQQRRLGDLDRLNSSVKELDFDVFIRKCVSFCHSCWLAGITYFIYRGGIN